MDEIDSVDALDDQIAALETTLGGAGQMTAAFDAELRRMQATVAETGKDVAVLSRASRDGLRRAFERARSSMAALAVDTPLREGRAQHFSWTRPLFGGDSGRVIETRYRGLHSPDRVGGLVLGASALRERRSVHAKGRFVPYRASGGGSVERPR